MKKLAVCLHLYYLDQLPDILHKLQSLKGTSYDLFVTMTEENMDVSAQILAAHPGAKIWTMENRGYDIGPFIDFLHRIDLSAYDYVLKLHTKGKTSQNYTYLNGLRLNNALWGRIMWESLLKSPSRLQKNIEILNKRTDVGMLGSRYCVTSARQDYEKLLPEVNVVLRRIGLSEVRALTFVAGAMFMVRTELLKPLLAYQLSDFEATDGRIKEGTLAHVMERVFGVLGTPISPIKHGHYDLTLRLVGLKRFFFQKKVTRSDKIIIKVCKIPVYIKELSHG